MRLCDTLNIKLVAANILFAPKLIHTKVDVKDIRRLTMNGALFAFMLTLIAGLATGVGGLISIFAKTTNTRFLSICLSLSAGVMLYISFAEILLEAFESLEYAYDMGYLIATVAFFCGVVLIALIDKLIPHDDGDFEQKDHAKSLLDKKQLKRTGIMSTTAIAMHNFPEGIVTFMAAMYDPVLGVAIATAIVIHNIPEGIAMAAPIYYSTGSKAKAMAASLFAGLTQLIGAFVAWLLLQNVFYDIEGVFGIAFAVVAGIMVFVAIHQLLPAAQKYGKHHTVIKWLFLGMAIMAISLIALEYAL